MGEKDERPSSGREFKEIFDYLFGSETDIRKAIPVSGVKKLGWGWAFLIAYYYSRLHPKFSEVDEEDKIIKPSFAKFVKALETLRQAMKS
jgi:superoxide dismutase